jgi:uncharacterized protein YjiS (DUF1127 family)
MMTMSNVVELFPAARSARVADAADGIIAELGGVARMWAARAVERRAIREMLRQPDSVLADAGWTRAAAVREAGKWFWVK